MTAQRLTRPHGEGSALDAAPNIQRQALYFGLLALAVGGGSCLLILNVSLHIPLLL